MVLAIYLICVAIALITGRFFVRFMNVVVNGEFNWSDVALYSVLSLFSIVTIGVYIIIVIIILLSKALKKFRTKYPVPPKWM
jgi:hypothetical protein